MRSSIGVIWYFPRKSPTRRFRYVVSFRVKVVEPLLRLKTINSKALWGVEENVRCFLREDGKYSDNQKLLLKALEISLSAFKPKDPRSLTTKFKLAHLYRAKGPYAEALKLQEKVLKTRKKILGRNPHTLTIDDIGISYAAIGRALAKGSQIQGSQSDDCCNVLWEIFAMYILHSVIMSTG